VTLRFFCAFYGGGVVCLVSCHQFSRPDHHAAAVGAAAAVAVAAAVAAAVVAAAAVVVVVAVAAVDSVGYLHTECLLSHTCCAHLTIP